MSLRQLTVWSLDKGALIKAAALLREQGGTPEDVSSKAGALGLTVVLDLQGASASQKLIRQVEALTGRGTVRVTVPGGDQRDSSELRETVRLADEAARGCGCTRVAEPVALHDALGRALGARLRYEASPMTLLTRLAGAGLQVTSSVARIDVDAWLAPSEDEASQSTSHPPDDKVSHE